MKAITSLTRIAILFAIAGVAFFCFFSEISDDSTAWMRDFLASRAIGVVAFLWLRYLLRLWRKQDAWLRWYFIRNSGRVQRTA